MNTITVLTSQNIELEYELGSIGDRLLGYLIDAGIIIAYIIILVTILNFLSFGRANMWFLLLMFLPVMLYSLISEIVLSGQSIGKKVMGIKVISLDGNQPSFGQYLMRWLFRLIDFLLMSGLVALIAIAISRKKQRLGDLVAGTVVVKLKNRTSLSETIFTPSSDPNYIVDYPEIVHLSDRDVQLIKEVLNNYKTSGNLSLAQHAQRKIEAVLNITSKENDTIVFLQKIISDYNRITSAI